MARTVCMVEILLCDSPACHPVTFPLRIMESAMEASIESF